jgi:hypothetical protein
MPKITPNTHQELDDLELGIEELDEMVDMVRPRARRARGGAARPLPRRSVKGLTL